MAKKNPLVARLFRDLSKLGNDAFKSAEYKHFLSLPLTRKRAAKYIFERSYFHLNRRNCWAQISATQLCRGTRRRSARARPGELSQYASL